ncbi:hypothetical protein CHS0354_035977 [Potamilus streckersoni]|uniref:Breast carcinoma-amplified sequence 3 n=1 Tax=Potamilus streckersoni TaxID=2493646 RepID=A0AAE0SBD1_9BIVA|nr:hypothetical protein CHS0354_035977 [Potamilus streckersoni]
MSADSPKRTFKYACNVVRPQSFSEKTVIESVVNFISDVVPQAYSGSSRTEEKETIQWVRFEHCDSNDKGKNPDVQCADSDGLPIVLVLGYSNGVQIWHVTPKGEAQEVMSLRQGPVKILRILPSPDQLLGYVDKYSEKRPLVAMCDSSCAGQPYCSVKFISLWTADEVHCVNFKTFVVQNIECNKRYIVITFLEKLCVYDANRFRQLFWISSCYYTPESDSNPIALSSRWLAYADRRLVNMHQSFGGMSGDGAHSYTATVISAAKGAMKGVSMFGEAIVSTVKGNKSSQPKRVETSTTEDGCQPGIVTVVDIQRVTTDYFCVNEDNEGDAMIAHFHAHANESVAALAFDTSGNLLATACKLGHNFHIFRLMAHPCGSSLGAVHHLYTLHRGDTTAQVTDIQFNHDSRWITISTHRGTTHTFPITPYGGPVNIRTHGSPHMVNQTSRFHKSAGIDEMDFPSAGRNSPPVFSGSPASLGQYEHYPSLIRQNVLNNNMGNPRMPPYPHPILVNPLYQIKQAINLTMTSAGKTQSPNHSPTGLDNIFAVAAHFSSPRQMVIGSPQLSVERRESSKRPVDSLFIMSESGMLIEYVLEPRPKAISEKVLEDCALELLVVGRMQWNLCRLRNSSEVKPPLPNNNPLILARDAIVTQQRTKILDGSEPGLVSRQNSKDSLASNHSGKEESENQWVSQVEIVTHIGPHRRLWMGPQFSFKTYQNIHNTTVLSSTSSALLSQSPEGYITAIDLTGDDCDLESLKIQPTRSKPVTMPMTRPAYRRQSGSDCSNSPGRGQLEPLLIEAAGSFDQSPQLVDVYSSWTDSAFEKQLRGSEEIPEDMIRETLADAMCESPTKEMGPDSMIQDVFCGINDNLSSSFGSSISMSHPRHSENVDSLFLLGGGSPDSLGAT